MLLFTRGRRAASFLLIAMLAIAQGPAAVSADPQGVVVTSVRGAVQCRSAAGGWTPLTSSGSLPGASAVKTGVDGEAVVQLPSGASLRVSPNSTLQVAAPPAGFVPLANTPGNAMSLELAGRVYANSPNQPLDFRTRAALVNTQGAEFVVNAEKDRTIVRVVHGYVSVKGERLVLRTYLVPRKIDQKQMLVGPGVQIIALLSNAIPGAAVVGGGVAAGAAAVALASGQAGSGAAANTPLSTQAQASSQADASR